MHVRFRPLLGKLYHAAARLSTLRRGTGMIFAVPALRAPVPRQGTEKNFNFFDFRGRKRLKKFCVSAILL